MLTDTRFHRRSNLQGLMNSSKVVVNVKDRQRVNMVLNLLALLHRMFENEQLLCFPLDDRNIKGDLFHTLAYGLVYGLGPHGASRSEEVTNPRWESFIDRFRTSSNS